MNLTTPYRIQANTTYVASVRALSGQYSSTPNAFTTAYTNGTLSVIASGGVTATTDVFPTATSTTNYFVDVVAAPQDLGRRLAALIGAEASPDERRT